MSFSPPDFGNGDIAKLAQSGLNIATFGAAGNYNKGLETQTKLEDMAKAGKAPTIEDAKNKVAEDPNAITKTKTYGRLGTILNQGGMRGIATGLLNLSSPTLMGKGQ